MLLANNNFSREDNNVDENTQTYRWYRYPPELLLAITIALAVEYPRTLIPFR